MRTLLILLTLAPSLVSAADRPDVLMIAIDDLRPMLGCYGDPFVKTPNIDRLAERGMLFEKAYCQFAKCGPSRTSLLSGLRPDTIGIENHGTRDLEDYRKRLGHLPTIPRHFKAHGYHTQGFGKIAHDEWDDAQDWSVPFTPGREGEMLEIADLTALQDVPYEQRASAPTVIASRHDCPAIQSPDVPDDALFAGRMTAQALEVLKTQREEPLFLAVGYRRPHLPFVAPKRYFDRYPINPDWLPDARQPAKGAPIMAWFNSDSYVGMLDRFGLDLPYPPQTQADGLRWAGFELRSYNGIPKDGPVSDDLQLQLRQAYMACISYVDAQVGQLLNVLDAQNRWSNTIVLLWSDHGWHLGEHGAWSKMTNYEIATRVPLIIAAPGNHPTGQTSQSLAELVDLYPTLCDLTHLPTPAHCEGSSLLPILNDPMATVNEVAHSQFPRFKKFLGRALRTSTHRYVEWTQKKDGTAVAEELYDHQADPYETLNIADDHPEIISAMKELSRE